MSLLHPTYSIYPLPSLGEGLELGYPPPFGGDWGEAPLLFNGRNQIRLFEHNGQRIVAKRYKRNNLIKQIIYTFLRKNKARRAYENARILQQKGFQTPREIAYIEERRLGLITQVYYLCEYTDAKAIRPRLFEKEPFDKPLAEAYAHYVASLHEAGVLHRDLNPTNVLYTLTEGQYQFQLIDINRMHFYQGPVPKDKCMENLTRFGNLSDVYRFVLQEYAATREWNENDMKTAINVKRKHDKLWNLRKRITKPFKKRQ